MICFGSAQHWNPCQSDPKKLFWRWCGCCCYWKSLWGNGGPFNLIFKRQINSVKVSIEMRKKEMNLRNLWCKSFFCPKFLQNMSICGIDWRCKHYTPDKSVNFKIIWRKEIRNAAGHLHSTTSQKKKRIRSTHLNAHKKYMWQPEIKAIKYGIELFFSFFHWNHSSKVEN